MKDTTHKKVLSVLLSLEINSAIPVQILDKAICISHIANNLEKV